MYDITRWHIYLDKIWRPHWSPSLEIIPEGQSAKEKIRGLNSFFLRWVTYYNLPRYILPMWLKWLKHIWTYTISADSCSSILLEVKASGSLQPSFPLLQQWTHTLSVVGLIFGLQDLFMAHHCIYHYFTIISPLVHHYFTISSPLFHHYIPMLGGEMRMFCSLATIKSLYYPGKRPQTVWGGVKGSCIIYI